MHSDAGILTIIMVKMQIFSNYIYIFRIMHTVQTSLCCIVFSYTLIWPISFRITSMALGQSYDCPSASEVILKDMGKCITWIHKHWWHNQNKALKPCGYSMGYTLLPVMIFAAHLSHKSKHDKTVCIFYGIYCITCNKIWVTKCTKNCVHILWGVQYYL